jgi:shikimate kinase
MRFVDFDSRLEAFAEQPADEIRALFGESRLKTLEDQLLSEIALYRGALILISGETLLRGALPLLRTTGPIICVTASIDAVLQRLHLAMGARFHDPRERDLAMGIVRRAWAVRGTEGVSLLDTSYLTDAGMVEAIAQRWRELAAVVDWRGV